MSPAPAPAGSPRAALRDPVLAPVAVLLWAAVALFVLYPVTRLLALTFWDHGPTLAAVVELVGSWQHRRALWNSLALAGLVAPRAPRSASPSRCWRCGRTCRGGWARSSTRSSCCR